MGTLVDERADVIDVTSTVIDLAVRNYLFIEELPGSSTSQGDWLLRRRNDAGDELLPYEREVFAAIFDSGDSSDAVPLGALDTRLRPRLGTIQALLYDDMVRQGWFGERPDAVRSRWTTAGWVLVAAGVVLTGVLAWVSTFGLVGLAVVLSGVSLASAGQVAPARTASGSRVLSELQDYRSFLAESTSADIPLGQREELVSRIFPYALVFGLGERWAASLAALDTDDAADEPLYWYGGPHEWHLSDSAPQLLLPVDRAHRGDREPAAARDRLTGHRLDTDSSPVRLGRPLRERHVGRERDVDDAARRGQPDVLELPAVVDGAHRRVARIEV